MRYIVAVSGGIDSVVLLHQLVMSGEHELIVAHFDHGIRPESSADARFVAGLAEKYSLPFIHRREELGVGAGEELARNRRYGFLRQVARRQSGTIVTAHHQDDVIESIAINLVRGTGWRGLAVLDSPDVFRPLLDQSKQALRQYAFEHRLEWVEDETNGETTYLRNRLRKLIAEQLTVDVKATLWGMWQQQVRLRQSIASEVHQFVHDDHEYSRYMLMMSDDLSAGELLRAMIAHAQQPTPTRPQLIQALLAIKVSLPGAVHQIGEGVQLRFTKRTFIVETTR